MLTAKQRAAATKKGTFLFFNLPTFGARCDALHTRRDCSSSHSLLQQVLVARYRWTRPDDTRQFSIALNRTSLYSRPKRLRFLEDQLSA
jgi:hypothetical protein